MNLFPYFLCRIGGAPFEHLSALEAKESLEVLDNVFQLRQKLSSLKEPVCNSLHELIAAETDHKRQNQLLNLKRSIFNGRPIRQNDMAETTSFVPAGIAKTLHDFYNLQEEIKLKTETAKSILTEEIIHAREELKRVTQDENLQKGLLLSSQLLLQNIAGYADRNPAAMRKKELKTEESLVKYLSRMSAKTSPFSTFTNLSLGKISADQLSNNTILNYRTGNSRMIFSHICLNNFLYAYLKAVLLKLPEVYRWFHIRPNPTISLQNETYVYLTNSNNIEAFQRIPANPVVELFHELTKDKKEGVVYDTMVREIIENEYFDASQEEIETYINQLVGYGFLEFNTGVSGIDPHWDDKLVEVLSMIKDKSALIADLTTTLKDVRQMAFKYEQATLEERKILLKQAYERFRNTCMQLHEAAGLPEDERKTPEELAKIAAEKKAEEEKKKQEQPENKEEEKTETLKQDKEQDKEEDTKEEENKQEEEAFMHRSSTYFHFKPEQMFYEDTTVNIEPRLNDSEAGELIQALSALLYSLDNFDGFLDDNEKIRQYFLNKYEENTSVDLMTFYEDFFRDIKKPEAEFMQKAKEKAALEAKKKEEEKKDEKHEEEKKENTPEVKPGEEQKPVIEVPQTKERLQRNKEWTEQFVKSFFERRNMTNEQMAVTQELGLTTEDLQKTEKIEDSYLRSYGSFMQVFRENGKLKAVVNGSFPGYGKMFSRFLHILDRDLTDKLREWNSPKAERELFIENCDASFFNANLHPPLMPFEIWMPGGQNTLPPDEQIPVTELSVVYNKQKDSVILQHTETGKEAYTFDLGFQGQKGRSQLFQLLTKFSLTKYLFWHPVTQAISNHANPRQAWDRITSPVVSPRITFEDTLVIQRKSWMVKKELLPKLDPNETEADYFCKVNLWRKQHAIPDEVFVFLTNHGEMGNLKPEEAMKLGRDSYKPQYINFNNPILVVNLLEKMISKVPVAMRIEEMLPNSSHMLSLDGKHYVTEFMMQWYENVSDNIERTSNVELSASNIE